jgi:hypothetical protein
MSASFIGIHEEGDKWTFVFQLPQSASKNKNDFFCTLYGTPSKRSHLHMHALTKRT